MVRSWATLGLCLGLAQTAYAESGVAPITVTVPEEIPSDGVLPLYGCRDARCSNLQSVVVTDGASGTRVEGRVEIVVSETLVGWGYFVPSEPFRSGASYSVAAMGGYSGYASPVSVSAADPVGLDESALGVQGGASPVRHVQDRRCCDSGCIDVSVVSTLLFTASMSALRPIATQYLFELSVHTEGSAGTVVTDFYPLRTDYYGSGQSSLELDGASASYCYTVRARSILGGEPFTLTTRCTANKFSDLGRRDLTPSEIAQWVATCEAAPVRIDAGVRGGAQADAAIAATDAATDADGEPLGRGEDKRLGEEESGCRLSGDRSRVRGMEWSLALLTLVLKRRRRAVSA